MDKDKSILEKFTDAMKGLADTASEALKSEEPANAPVASYMPLGAEGLVSDPLLVPPVAAQPVRKKQRAAKKAAKGPSEPPRWQRELSKGSPRVTFLVGAALTLPGASYLAGLASIHKLHYGTPETVLLVIGFNVVMLWLLEVPFVSFLLAPEKTPQAIARAKAWVSRHSHTFAVRGFGAIGILLVIKGLIGYL